MTDTSNRVVKTALTPHSYTTRDVTIADMLVVLGYDTVYEALEAMCLHAHTRRIKYDPHPR